MDEETAVVLGGGGITGMAWKAGILADLQDNRYQLENSKIII
ncbi:hypothetical protein [Staphylococcus simiae]|nr:hypothetical protein [Staphylococcus simiae]